MHYSHLTITLLTSTELPRLPNASEVHVTPSVVSMDPYLQSPVDPESAQENILYARALNSEVHISIIFIIEDRLTDIPSTNSNS